MYLYFDKFGILKEIINDGSVRYGDVDSNTFYVYIEDEPKFTSLTMILQRPDKTTSKEYFFDDAVIKEVPYNKDRDLKYFKDYKEYRFYTLTLTGSDISMEGLYLATLRAVSETGIKAQGMVTFNAEKNVINSDNLITQSQYDYLLEQIGGVKGAYLKSVDYNSNEYIFEFIDQNNIKYTYTLPFKDVYAKLEQLQCDINYNRIGLLDVSEYDTDTGEITYAYNPSVINNMEYNENDGLLTIYGNPIDWSCDNDGGVE